MYIRYTYIYIYIYIHIHIHVYIYIYNIIIIIIVIVMTSSQGGASAGSHFGRAAQRLKWHDGTHGASPSLKGMLRSP